MNKQLEKLYISLAEDTENDPFHTPEIDEKYNAFFNTYSQSTLQKNTKVI